MEKSEIFHETSFNSKEQIWRWKIPEFSNFLDEAHVRWVTSSIDGQLIIDNYKKFIEFYCLIGFARRLYIYIYRWKNHRKTLTLILIELEKFWYFRESVWYLYHIKLFVVRYINSIIQVKSHLRTIGMKLFTIYQMYKAFYSNVLYTVTWSVRVPET